jgi:hypothetical protein
MGADSDDGNGTAGDPGGNVIGMRRTHAGGRFPSSITDKILGRTPQSPAGQTVQGATPPPEANDPPAPPADDSLPESFNPESADYKAYGRCGPITLPSLRLIFKDGSEKQIVYAHLDSHSKSGSEFLPSTRGSGGDLILLRIAGQSEAFHVAIEGLRLRPLWELLMLHRVPWIWELPKGALVFRKDEPVIRYINFKSVAAEDAARA